ncbi:hypothetical protein KY327_03590 [Candidatus Woesearchaeota archaeon]|nr:hypothetical protein [Candidatus Woesearchaeota archaeon]
MTRWPPLIELIEGEVHRYFLLKTYEYAAAHSEDPATKTAALITTPDLKEIIAYDANRFPPGIHPTEAQILDKEWKKDNIRHAEAGTILAANGQNLEGTIMYMPWVPCEGCAQAIKDAGISTLIGHQDLIERTPERWRESTGRAVEYLKREGVDLYAYKGRIGGITHRFDSQDWQP